MNSQLIEQARKKFLESVGKTSVHDLDDDEQLRLYRLMDIAQRNQRDSSRDDFQTKGGQER